jgi:hypothetical protein
MAANIIAETLEGWILRTSLIGLANAPDDNLGARRSPLDSLRIALEKF